MMKKLVALLMALAMLCSSIAAFAEVVPNDNPSPAPALKPEDYVDSSDMDEWKNHEDCETAKSGQSKNPIAATCTTPEYQWYICKDHPVRFWMPVGDPLDHDFSVFQSYVEGKEPTYTKGGEAIYKCIRCDETETREVDPLTTAYGPTEEYTEYIETPDDGHHKHGWYSIKLSTDPTCTEDGFYKILCADCGEIYQYTNEEKEALGHDVKNPQSEITTPRTCTVDGVKTYKGYCERCKQDVTWTEPFKAPGHDFNGVVGVEIKAATCTENQVQRFICKVCQFPDDREVPDTKLRHTWETGESQETHDHVVKQPTCAAEGSIGDAVICDRCGAPNPETLETVQKIDAIDHAAEWEDRVYVVEDEEDNPVYFPDYMQFIEDLYKELVALGVEIDDAPELGEDSSISDVIEMLSDVPPATLLKALENVKADMNPLVGYLLPGADVEAIMSGEDPNIVYLMWEDAIPKYEIPIEVKITTDLGDAEKGIEPTVETVTTTGLVHETKVVYNAPTCTASGSIVLTCTVCDAEPYVIELPKLEHVYIPIRGVRGINDLEGVVIKDCTQANSILQQCIFCGHRYNQAIEPAKSHIIELDSEEFNPWNLYEDDDNCMIVGFVQQKEWDDAPITYYVNEKMSDTMHDFYYGSYGTYKENVVDAFSHIATCRDFDIIVKCAVDFCEHTEKIHVAAFTKHNASKYDIDIDPTCTKPGYIGFNCEKCGEFHTEERNPNGHDPIDGKTLVEPTCTEKGSREIICSVCKEVIGTEEIPALDHHFVPYFERADCKIGKVGVSYQYCSICNYIDPDSVVEDDGHRYEEEDITAYTAPTCTTKGSRSFVCKICHKDVDQVINATGHNPVEVKTVPASCKTGAEHGTQHYYECSNCDAAGRQCPWTDMKEDKDIPEHNMFKVDGSLNRFNVVTMPTCEKEGKAQFVCTRCGDLVKDLVLPALPHNYQIKFNEKLGAYELVCSKIELTDLNLWTLAEKMEANGYHSKVAAAITDLFRQSEGTNIKGVGCGDVQPIEIRKTEYTITKVSETRGQIELVEGALGAKDDEYVRIVWRYTLGNKDTISFVTTREVRWTYDEETGKYIGSFKLTGLTVPEDAECNFIRVEVVTDPDADEKYAGQYDAYGYEVWKY